MAGEDFVHEDASAGRAEVLRGVLRAIEQIDVVTQIVSASEDKLDAARSLDEQLGLGSSGMVVLDLQIFRLTRKHRAQLVDELENLQSPDGRGDGQPPAP